MERLHALLFFASFIALAIATAIAADWIDSSYLSAWVLAGAALFAAAHAARES